MRWNFEKYAYLPILSPLIAVEGKGLFIWCVFWAIGHFLMFCDFYFFFGGGGAVFACIFGQVRTSTPEGLEAMMLTIPSFGD